MAGATLTTLSNVMKNYYLGPVQEQLNNEILVMQILKVDSENLEGLQAVISLHNGRSGGIGARGELETLPSAGNQTYSQAVYDLKYLYARVQVSGPGIAKTKSDAGSFLRAMQSELDYIREDLALDFARQVYGDGSAQIAQAATTTTSATVNLSSDEPLRKGFLYVGAVIDIGDSGANPTSVASARTITDVDVANKTITISGATVSTTSSHFIYRSGNVVSGTVREMDAGLSKLVSTAANSVGGINAASAGNKYWDNLRDTTGGAISLDNLMLDWNLANAAGARADQIKAITTPGIARRLFGTSDFKSNVRFVNSTAMKGGFESISFSAGSGSINLVTDRLAPFGKVFMLDTKHVRLFSPADWDFLSRDGLTVRWVTDVDAFQSVLFRYANMGTDRRGTSLVMSGLTDTNGA